MQPSELNYSIHYTSDIDYEEYGTNSVIITLCPITYWNEHKCLPDYYFSDQIAEELLPEGYEWLTCVEECQWISKKTKEDIRIDLNVLGFVERLDMEEFLTSCY
jgi:hypothetical protein